MYAFKYDLDFSGARQIDILLTTPTEFVTCSKSYFNQLNYNYDKVKIMGEGSSGPRNGKVKLIWVGR